MSQFLSKDTYQIVEGVCVFCSEVQGRYPLLKGDDYAKRLGISFEIINMQKCYQEDWHGIESGKNNIRWRYAEEDSDA